VPVTGGAFMHRIGFLRGSRSVLSGRASALRTIPIDSRLNSVAALHSRGGRKSGMSKSSNAGGANDWQAKLNAYKRRVLGEETPTQRGKNAEGSSQRQGALGKRKAPQGSERNGAKRQAVEKAGKGRKPPSRPAKTAKGRKMRDPSTLYLSNPLKAPLCKEAAAFMRQGAGLRRRFEMFVGSTKGWRTSAKLSVRGNPPVIGLFAPGSHDVIPMTESVAHHPCINRVLTAVNEVMQQNKDLKGYDGINPGGVSYLCANVETHSKQIQLIFVVNDKSPRPYETAILAVAKEVEARLSTKYGPVIHSVWVHCNPTTRYQNNIYSYDENAWHILEGKERIIEVMTDNDGTLQVKPKLYFPPYVFRQANTAGFARIVASVRRWTLEGANTVELYGGVGTIGLHLLDLIPSLICSDENPHNKACFDLSLKTLPAKLAKKASYRQASASKMAEDGALDNAEQLIVDPPRKGMDESIILRAVQSPTLQRVIYVSCGFKSFQRDCKVFRDNGFSVVHGEGHVLFPGANHLETLAIFERVEEVAFRSKQLEN